jgi:oligopeptide/dipeptide ABC transporter ATP-binding protein
MSDRLAVIYAGRIVEAGPAAQVTATPAHPYTRALLDAVPATRPSERAEVPPAVAAAEAVTEPETACPFAPRCPRRQERCVIEVPQLVVHGKQQAACHFPLVDGDQSSASSSASFQAASARARCV